MLEERGEVVVEFALPAGYHANYFSSWLSVDQVMNDTITAYANRQQFDSFLLLDIPFRVLTPPSLERLRSEKEEEHVAKFILGYPSYGQYVEMMQDFAGQHPDLCRLVEYGRSVEGRKLFALKITDHPDTREREPAFLYSATLHGDEVVGYVLMLRLIAELLDNYGTDQQITDLVDHIEIWINPLSNPDGTYFLSDESVYGATRGNANFVDLNRNFPDPESGDHPDGNAWQDETVALMDLMKSMHLVLAANFHGGVEVVNYPWDTWSRLHADDTWYRGISRAYADTVHIYSAPGYMTFMENGITNGFSWYSISGGKQDYCNYFLQAREVTIELSDDKIPGESELDTYWECNKRSLLGYMEQVLFGVAGTVTDASTGSPVRAEVVVAGHDKDSSQVFSSAETGDFYRLLPAGDVTLSFHSPGYQEADLTVQVPYHDRIFLDVRLKPSTDPYSLYPNPFADRLFIYIPEGGGDMHIELFDALGRMIMSFSQPVTVVGLQQIDTIGLTGGMYVIRVTYKGRLVNEKVIRTKR